MQFGSIDVVADGNVCASLSGYSEIPHVVVGNTYQAGGEQVAMIASLSMTQVCLRIVHPHTAPGVEVGSVGWLLATENVKRPQQ